MTILFESPNVFKVLLNYCEHKCFPICEACEQYKANAIRIDNPEILPILARYGSADVRYKINENYEYLKHGDIFQVDGFEYEISGKCCIGRPHILTCGFCNDFEKIAILKLAKEDKRIILTATEKYKYETDAKFREELLSGLRKTDEDYEKQRIERHVKGLAKEEEPKETPNKIVNDTNKSEWNLALESVTHNLKLRGFNEQDYNGKILFEEIEKLKK